MSGWTPEEPSAFATAGEYLDEMRLAESRARTGYRASAIVRAGTQVSAAAELALRSTLARVHGRDMRESHVYTEEEIAQAIPALVEAAARFGIKVTR